MEQRRGAFDFMNDIVVGADNNDIVDVESNDEEDIVEEILSNGDSSSDDDEIIDAPPAANLQRPPLIVTYTSKDGLTEWSTDPPIQHRRQAHNVLRHAGGPTVQPDNIIDAFHTFFTPEMIEICVHYTNIHAANIINSPDCPPYIRDRWRDTDTIEMHAFIGLLLLFGVYRSNNESYEQMWSQDMGRAIFRACMSLERFKLLLRFIRFDDRLQRIAQQPADLAERDRLAPFRDIWNLFVQSCRNSYRPSENVTIDEQLVGFRGRCPFRVYMPKKPNRYGIKIWICADSTNAYCFNLEIYLGKTGLERDRPLGQQVIESLVQPLHYSGRNITCDRFFTSMRLADSLLQRNLTLLGTLAPNKALIPRELTKNRRHRAGSSIITFSGNKTLMFYVPKVSKAVHILSTTHHTADLEVEPPHKPVMINDYNNTKWGVDAIDQMVGTYSSNRQCRRWPNKLFCNMLDIAALNAYIIYTELYPDWNRNRNYKRRLFLAALSKDLIRPLVQRRVSIPTLKQSTKASISMCGLVPPLPVAAPLVAPEGDRGRCLLCPTRKQIRPTCSICHHHVCSAHSSLVCNRCQ